jgi:hypothetical protein
MKAASYIHLMLVKLALEVWNATENKCHQAVCELLLKKTMGVPLAVMSLSLSSVMYILQPVCEKGATALHKGASLLLSCCRCYVNRSIL